MDIWFRLFSHRVWTCIKFSPRQKDEVYLSNNYSLFPSKTNGSIVMVSLPHALPSFWLCTKLLEYLVRILVPFKWRSSRWIPMLSSFYMPLFIIHNFLQSLLLNFTDTGCLHAQIIREQQDTLTKLVRQWQWWPPILPDIRWVSNGVTILQHVGPICQYERELPFSTSNLWEAHSLLNASMFTI